MLEEVRAEDCIERSVGEGNVLLAVRTNVSNAPTVIVFATVECDPMIKDADLTRANIENTPPRVVDQQRPNLLRLAATPIFVRFSNHFKLL